MERRVRPETSAARLFKVLALGELTPAQALTLPDIVVDQPAAPVQVAETSCGNVPI